MAFPSTHTRAPTIPLITIGITRAVAISVSKALSGTPYYVAAALDQTESPAPYQFTAHNLVLILHALHPRPRAIVTGTAVDEEVMAAVEGAWEEYRKGVLETEQDSRGVWVAVSFRHWTWRW